MLIANEASVNSWVGAAAGKPAINKLERHVLLVSCLDANRRYFCLMPRSEQTYIYSCMQS
jgi:hypothetical protein